MSRYSYQELIDPDEFNVYLAGPLSDVDYPGTIHNSIKSEVSNDVNWIDPLEFDSRVSDNGWEMIWKDLRAVETVDAVFCYRKPGAESWGTKFEAIHALRVHTPVAIWNMDKDEQHNHWMELPFPVCDTPVETMDALRALCRIYR